MVSQEPKGRATQPSNHPGCLSFNVYRRGMIDNLKGAPENYVEAKDAVSRLLLLTVRH